MFTTISEASRRGAKPRGMFVLIAWLFLCSYVPIASAREFYVAPHGDDANPGTLVLPWRKFADSIAKLRPGDSLYVRGGTYTERGIAIGVAGTAARPIRIRSYPGERPIIDGSYQEFQKAENQAWLPYDTARTIYRSAMEYSDPGGVFGNFAPEQGGFRLVPYERYEPFASDDEEYAATGNYYIGPGVFWRPDDHRIYIRLQTSKYREAMSGPALPTTDPRKLGVSIFPYNKRLLLSHDAAYLEISGIDFRGQSLEFESGAHHISVKDATILGGRYHVLVRDRVRDVVFERITIREGLPPWLARSDVKFPNQDIRPPGHSLQGAGINLTGGACNIDIGYSTFLDLFDAVDANQSIHGVRIHDNFISGIRDDGFSLGTAAYDVEVDHNVMTGVHLGISRYGAGAAPAGQIGKIYLHHNVIDSTKPHLIGRSDANRQGLPQKWAGPTGDGMGSAAAFGLHVRQRMTGPAPWKIYNNTIKVGYNSGGDGGAGHIYRLELIDASVPHEVYNNIIIQSNDYHLAARARVADGSQIYDGNLYFRDVDLPDAPLFHDWTSNGAVRNFSSLAEFKRSTFFTATKTRYRPGWESAGIEADPDLDSAYRPAPSGPATTGAVDLSGSGWPGTGGGSYRGALSPAAQGTAEPFPFSRSAERTETSTLREAITLHDVCERTLRQTASEGSLEESCGVGTQC